MKIKHENYDRVTVINVSGDITVDEIEPLRSLCQKRLEADTRDFVLELSETEFADSKALEMLLWLQEQAGERLGQIRLAAAPENLQRILNLTRLEHHFDLHNDVDAALKSLR